MVVHLAVEHTASENEVLGSHAGAVGVENRSGAVMMVHVEAGGVVVGSYLTFGCAEIGRLPPVSLLALPG